VADYGLSAEPWHIGGVFDRVSILVSDLVASERFYLATLRALGIARDRSGADFAEWNDFSIAHANDETRVTRRLHVGFVAPSREHVEEFWRAGIEAGYRDDGPPGPRPQYRDEYYGSFLLDPDGNSAEAVHHGVLRTGGVIDHLWIRVADVAAAKSFYELVAPYAGFHLRRDLSERAQFADGPAHRGSFSLVPGEPTLHLAMAFPATRSATVEQFHRAAVAAGYQDNGAPVERSGCYGASVLDPDGNVIEVRHRSS
jgi:predicted lactoylglutathione lyase